MRKTLTALFLAAALPSFSLPAPAATEPVSYSHLTLPTNRPVDTSVGSVSLKNQPH